MCRVAPTERLCILVWNITESQTKRKIQVWMNKLYFKFSNGARVAISNCPITFVIFKLFKFLSFDNLHIMCYSCINLQGYRTFIKNILRLFYLFFCDLTDIWWNNIANIYFGSYSAVQFCMRVHLNGVRSTFKYILKVDTIVWYLNCLFWIRECLFKFFHSQYCM